MLATPLNNLVGMVVDFDLRFKNGTGRIKGKVEQWQGGLKVGPFAFAMTACIFQLGERFVMDDRLAFFADGRPRSWSEPLDQIDVIPEDYFGDDLSLDCVQAMKEEIDLLRLRLPMLSPTDREHAELRLRALIDACHDIEADVEYA